MNNNDNLPLAREKETTLDRLPTLLTVDELAQVMRLNRKTVYDALHAGEIPGVRRIGRAIRIVRSVVVEWLRQGRVSRSSRSVR